MTLPVPAMFSAKAFPGVRVLNASLVRWGTILAVDAYAGHPTEHHVSFQLRKDVVQHFESQKIHRDIYARLREEFLSRGVCLIREVYRKLAGHWDPVPLNWEMYGVTTEEWQEALRLEMEAWNAKRVCPKCNRSYSDVSHINFCAELTCSLCGAAFTRFPNPQFKRFGHAPQCEACVRKPRVLPPHKTACLPPRKD